MRRSRQNSIDVTNSHKKGNSLSVFSKKDSFSNESSKNHQNEDKRHGKDNKLKLKFQIQSKWNEIKLKENVPSKRSYFAYSFHNSQY